MRATIKSIDGSVRWAFVIWVMLTVILLGKTAHCATTSAKKHNNSIGALMYVNNPYTYIAGSVTAGFAVEQNLVLRVQPLSTYSLFTQDLLFCDSPVELLDGKSNPVVLVYETVSHRAVEGIGCHNLVRVEELKSDVQP
jgi:hypothetical protein